MRRSTVVRNCAALLLAILAVGLTAVGGAEGAGGMDGRSCGTLDDTRSVQLTAYSVSCSKASQVVKLAARRYITRSKAHSVSGTYLGFSCRGAVSKRRISMSCRRGGGAQYLTARGRV